ncbi:MAG: hypothetical protein AAGC86_04845 [Pseudomonadota bacterium]
MDVADIGFPTFVDAEISRQRGISILAMQRISPNRSFAVVDLPGTLIFQDAFDHR